MNKDNHCNSLNNNLTTSAMISSNPAHAVDIGSTTAVVVAATDQSDHRPSVRWRHGLVGGVQPVVARSRRGSPSGSPLAGGLQQETGDRRHGEARTDEPDPDHRATTIPHEPQFTGSPPRSHHPDRVIRRASRTGKARRGGPPWSSVPVGVRTGSRPVPGASMRRTASLGMIWKATVSAKTSLSFRRMCTWPSPGSTKPSPAWYRAGVQDGSSPRYAVISPAVTMMRLGPGWVCHPLLAARRDRVARDVDVGFALSCRS